MPPKKAPAPKKKDDKKDDKKAPAPAPAPAPSLDDDDNLYQVWYRCVLWRRSGH
jgi:hypothetical protein